ncbi:exodeoxyribonuclease VII small subunit [Calothrix sp. 336/3]|uniref:exodeoxyribonuclease VII small subunit n=1 Tax=Calothrix sp. 336/3 TaxID=1337936 RepID=UPI0004E32022|nr:exodeoxyribonuclease VII small subunit [Calothrix sp. 336/3]AKG20114.1 exodeoxyribonuclease VII [Calothrix sp. 336/3]
MPRGKSNPSKDWSYEEKVGEIEKIISRIETGELDLQQVFTEFATAVDFLHECEQFLLQKQQQVDLLIEKLEDD